MRRYHKNSNGFTMAEMLITVAIIVILCGFGFVAVIAHQRNLKRMEMDETAQEIFIAAQNHLTAARANGQWSSFLEKTAAGGQGGSRGTAMEYVPSDYNKASDADAASRKFYYFTTESAEAVKNGAEALILPEGSIDETLRGHHFYVEYDAASGTVFGVFYTDSDHAITAENAQAVSRTEPNDRRDYKVDGKRTIIGYYGGALGELNSPGDLYAPSVAVRNAESLVLYVVDKNYYRPVSSKTGAQNFKTKLKLTFEGVTSGEKTVKEVDPSSPSSQTDVFSSAVLAEESEGTFNVVIPSPGASAQQTKAVKAEYYAIVLDSIVRKDGHFADLFPEFIPGEDIRITVTLTSDKAGEDVSQTVTVNSLFNSVKTEKNLSGIASKTVVTVSNPRHLENLSSEVSGVDFAVAGKQIVKDTTVDTVSVVRNLFWDKDAEAEKGEAANEKVTAFIPAIASATGMKSEYGYNAGGAKDAAAITKENLQVYPYSASGTENAANSSGNSAPTSAGEGENLITKGSCYGITNTAIKSFEGNNHILAAFRFEGKQNAALINEAADGLTVSDLLIADVSSVVTGEKADGTGSEETPAAAILLAKAKSGSIENIAVRWYEDGVNQSVTLPAGSNVAAGMQGCRVYAEKGIASALIGSVDAKQAGSAAGSLEISNVSLCTMVKAASPDGKKVTAHLGIEGETTAVLLGEIKSGAVKLDNSNQTEKDRKSYVCIEGTLSLKSDKGQEDSQASGGLIGRISGGEDALVKQLDFTASRMEMETKGGAAGGFVGIISGGQKAGLEEISLSANSLDVTGKTAAGGAVGNVSAGELSLNKINIITTKENKQDCREAGQETNGTEKPYGIRVTAENGTAGGLLGAASSSVTKLEITEAAVSGSGTADQVKAGSSAGGLIGDTKASKTTIMSSAASLYIRSEGNGGNVGGSSSTDGAGGLIGSASGNVTITSSYSGGRTTNASDPDEEKSDTSAKQARYVNAEEGQGRYNVYLASGSGAAGGLLGKFNGTTGSLKIENSYSTSSVAIPYSSGSTGAAAGGLVGDAGTTTFTANNTYCTGRVYANGAQNGTSVGTATGGTTGGTSGSTAGTSTPNYGIYAGKLGGISGSGNYYLKGMNGIPSDAVGTLKGKTSDITIAENVLAGADYYDDNCALKQGVDSAQKSYYFDPALAGKGYPFKTATTAIAWPVCDPDTGMRKQNAEDDTNRFAQIGDWEIPKEESSETEFGPYALIYYERIWDPETKSLDPTIYYHGYAIPDGAKGSDGTVKYKEISTKDGKLSAGINWNEHHLVTSKGKYVAEDGYLLLVSNETIKNAGGANHLHLHVRDSGGINNTVITESRYYTAINTLDNISEQNEIIDQCDDFKGYTAYTLDVINNNNTYRFRPYTKDVFGAGITIWKTKTSVNNIEEWDAEAGFTYVPFFADAVRGADHGEYQSVSKSWAYNSADNTYIDNGVQAIIRSAEQLQNLAKFGAVSDGYLSWSAQSVWIEQKLDITFDDSKVLFHKKGKVLLKDKIPDRYQSPTIKSINSGNKFSSSMNEQGDYYVLDGLNNRFVEKVQGGSIFDLRITNMNAESVIDSVQQNGGDQTGAYVYNIHVSNSRLKKGMFRNITLSKVRDCNIFNSEIQENGFAETITNSADVSNCNITDAKIGKNGFAGEIGESNNCKVQNCVISNSTIEENGFAFELKGNGSSIINCTIVNALIGENGFVNQYDGTISGCALYANSDLYKENEVHNYKPYSSDNGTYDYIAIGVKENGSKCKNSIAGFAKSSKENAKIENCSVTGCIYGSNDVSGFAEKVSGGNKIISSYANVIIYTEKNGSGFVNTIDGAGSKIQNCHALGMIRKAQNASGFISSLKKGSVLGNYEAFWNISANKWSPFYAGQKNSGTVSNNYYLTDCEINVQEIAGYDDYAAAEVQGEAYTELTQTTINGLDKTDMAHTKGYYRYMTSSSKTYPYPMPSGQIAYGDWSCQKEDGTLSLVYYEKMEDAAYHVHGFETLNGENYNEIGTLYSQPDITVSEDGYLLIAKKGVLAANFTSTQRKTGISAPEDISKTNLFVKVDEDNLINELSKVTGIKKSDLVAYKFNLDAYWNYTEQDTWKTLSNSKDCERKFRNIDTLKESSEGIGILIYTQTGQHVKFSFQPIFADTVHAANVTENTFCSTVEDIQSGKNYRIRSARQLLALSRWDEEVRTKGLDSSEQNASRASYLSTMEEHGASSLCVRQDLDIEVNTPVNFKRIDGTYFGKIYETNTENRPVKISGLCSTFADSVAQRGNISSLILNGYLSEQNSANLSDGSAFKGFIKENNGKISGITVRNSKLGSAGLVYLNKGINGQNGRIESCAIENSTIQGAGLVYTNNGCVEKCTVKDCIIQGSGFVYENIKNNYSTGQMSECNIKNCSVQQDGFVRINQGGVIKNSNVYDSSIKGNGFAGTNTTDSRQNYGSAGVMSECNIKNCSVQQDGFVRINQGGVIKNSNVYDSSIKGNGFAGTNTTDSQQNYGSAGVIESCNIVNANIGKMGFAEENKCNNAVIKNCQIYGDVDDYLKYCLEYSDKTKRKFQCYDDNWNPIEDPVMPENEQGNISEEKKSKIGYFLIRVGISITSNGDVEASDQSKVICTGFVNENMNAEITNCSFTGTIKGTSKSIGFVGTNAGSISGSYANSMLEGEDVSGFVYENSRGSGNGIIRCHSIGKIQFSKSGCGFIGKLGESNFQNSVQQSYAAIAEVKGSAEQYMLWGAAEKNQYSPAYFECYVMYPMKTNVGLKNDVPISVKKCTSNQLSTGEWKNKLGHVAGSKTVVYAQYNSDLKQGDTYPFPCGSDITNYGDWKLTDGNSAAAHTITLAAGSMAVFPEDVVRSLSADAAIMAASDDGNTENADEAAITGTGNAYGQDTIPEEDRHEVQLELGEEEETLDLAELVPVRKGWKLLGWLITSPSELSASEKTTTVSDVVTKINKISDGDAEASGFSKAVYELETGTKSYHYAPDAVITVTEDMTLSAVWVPDDDTVEKAKDGTLRMDENGNILEDESEAESTGTTETSEAGTTESSTAGTTETSEAGTTESSTAGTTETPEEGTTESSTAGTTETPEAGTTESSTAGTTETPEAGTTEPSTAGTTETTEEGTTESGTTGTTEASETESTESTELSSSGIETSAE